MHNSSNELKIDRLNSTAHFNYSVVLRAVVQTNNISNEHIVQTGQ